MSEQQLIDLPDILQEQGAPPMAQEFPTGERVIFLGQMAYGTAAQVAGSSKDTLDINLAVRITMISLSS